MTAGAAPPDISKQRRPWLKRIDWGFAVILVLSVGSALAVLLRDGRAIFFHVLQEDIQLFIEVVPKVIAGTLLGGLVRLLVPRQTVKRWIGEGSGLLGLLIATVAGALFPAGPFTIFPLAAGFLIAGADRGAAIAFISAWLLLGVNRALIWEMPFFGPELVALRSIVSLPMPMLAGWLARSIPLHLFMGR
ncbi:MAG: permease [Beijerinckiaceae bacterium]